MPASTLSLGQLLFGWHLSASSGVVTAVITLAGMSYVVGIRRLAARGRRWSRWRAASWIGGLLSIVVALDSGMASYDESVFTVHVVQHLILMSTAPPLLALGAPVTLALQTLDRRKKTALLSVLHTPIARFASNPLIGFVASMGAMYGYFLTGLYPYSIAHPLFHEATHAAILAAGCLYWWPIVSADPIPRRLGYGPRIGVVLAAIPFNAFLGIAIMNMSAPISPVNTLADTHNGGGLLWGVGELFTLGALGVLFAGWAKEEERKGKRQDRLAEARLTAEQAKTQESPT